MTRAAATCDVCHYPQADGSFSDDGKFFVCSRCQANAKRLIEIQDEIWPSTTETSPSSEAPDNPADP